jgi:hypothetical protein
MILSVAVITMLTWMEGRPCLYLLASLFCPLLTSVSQFPLLYLSRVRPLAAVLFSVLLLPLSTCLRSSCLRAGLLTSFRPL